jgi:hypothetical protein
VPSLDILPVEHVSACVAAPGEPLYFAQPRAQIAPKPDENCRIGNAPGDREMPASVAIGRGEVIAPLRMTGNDHERVTGTEIAGPMGVDASDDEPIRQEATMALAESACAQHPDPCSDTGALTGRAGSGSALRAKLAEFTRNRPKGPTWID